MIEADHGEGHTIDLDLLVERIRITKEYLGQLVIHLKPRTQRKILVGELIEQIRPKLTGFPGMRVYLQNPPTIQIGGQVTKSLYQFSMQTPDKQELYAQTERLAKLVAMMGGRFISRSATRSV